MEKLTILNMFAFATIVTNALFTQQNSRINLVKVFSEGIQNIGFEAEQKKWNQLKFDICITFIGKQKCGNDHMTLIKTNYI